MADTQHFTPTVQWAQRKDVIYLTVCVEDCKNPVLDLTENNLKFCGKGGTEKHTYTLDMEFLKEVNPQESKKVVKDRNIQLVIKKKEEGPYWPHLLKDKKKVHWLHTDFNKWRDEDDSEEDDDKDMNLQDMMSSLGGMGGMGGGDGPADLADEDSDDEDLPDLE